MGPLLPAAAGALAVLAWWKKPWKQGMTAERKVIYETAMRTLKEPAKLRDLAKGFLQQGHRKEAAMLERRAKTLELPEETKAAHRDAFEKAMKSTDVENIQLLAEAFEQQGQTVCASVLRNYAEGLKTAEDAAQ